MYIWYEKNRVPADYVPVGHCEHARTSLSSLCFLFNCVLRRCCPDACECVMHLKWQYYHSEKWCNNVALNNSLAFEHDLSVISQLRDNIFTNAERLVMLRECYCFSHLYFEQYENFTIFLFVFVCFGSSASLNNAVPSFSVDAKVNCTHWRDFWWL